MSTTDPKKKIALSNHFTRGYSKVLESEVKINSNIIDLLSKIDTYAEDQTAMELDKFITYTTFDNIGTAFFSEPFGFIKAVRSLLPIRYSRFELNDSRDTTLAGH